MSEHKKHLSCAWCDGEIGCGNKGYRRSGYYGVYCSLECLVKGSRLQYEEVIINEDIFKSECER